MHIRNEIFSSPTFWQHQDDMPLYFWLRANVVRSLRHPIGGRWLRAGWLVTVGHLRDFGGATYQNHTTVSKRLTRLARIGAVVWGHRSSPKGGLAPNVLVLGSTSAGRDAFFLDARLSVPQGDGHGALAVAGLPVEHPAHALPVASQVLTRVL